MKISKVQNDHHQYANEKPYNAHHQVGSQQYHWILESQKINLS